MGRSGKRPDKELNMMRQGIICFAAVGLATVSMAGCAVIPLAASVTSPAGTVTPETSALMAEPSAGIWEDIWQDDRDSDALTTVQMKTAIVNLDEGVVVDGVKVRYSDEILPPLDPRYYQFASFSEASAGLKDGRFGAVIQVPPSFSECIESINGIPDRCVLRYEISDLANDHLKYALVQKVYDFDLMLSNDISFMYISNMMTQYHESQDEAKVVMDNDRADLDALLGIQYADLVSLVEVKTFTGEELSAELPDLLVYSDRQADLSADLRNSFDQALGNVNHAFAQVFDQASQLGNGALSAAEALPALLTEEKLDDTETLTAVRECIVTGLTEEITMKKQSDEISHDDMINALKQFNDILNESIDIQNNDHKTAWMDTLDQLTDDYRSRIPILVIDTSDDHLRIYYQSDDGDEISPVTEVRWESDEGVYEDALLEQKRDMQYELMYRLAAGSDDETLTNSTLSAFESEYADDLYACGYGSAAELLTDDLYGQTSTADGSFVIEGDLSSMDAYLEDTIFDQESLESSKASFIPFEDKAYSMIAVTDSSVSEEAADEISEEASEDVEASLVYTLTGELAALEDALAGSLMTSQTELDEIVSRMTESADQEIVTMIHEMLTEPADVLLSDAVKTANDAITQTDEAAQEIITDTQSFQNNGSAIADEVSVTDYNGAAFCMDMDANYADLLSACAMYSNDVRGYAYDLHTATVQYGNDLVKDVARIKSDTDQRLSDGLADVRDQRQESFDENQRILTDFVNSLYYTRLGSRENSTLYRYVADPVTAEDVHTTKK